MRFLATIVAMFCAAPIAAESLDDCLKGQVTIKANNIRAHGGSAAFELTLANNLPNDLAGLAIEYTLQADDRPTPLREGILSSTLKMGGALLAGETAQFTDYIGLFEREWQLAQTASALTLKLELVNVADTQFRPALSTAFAPAIWNGEGHSSICKGGSE